MASNLYLWKIATHKSTRKLSILHTTHLAHDIIPLSLLITELDQETTPAELPIFGDPDSDIVLDLVFPKGNTLFSLSGKKLRLLAPLDRDADNLSHIVFQVSTYLKYLPTSRFSLYPHLNLWQKWIYLMLFIYLFCGFMSRY